MWYTFILMIGILIFGIAIFLFLDSLAFLKTSERAVGTVVELKKNTDSEGDSFEPVFRYRTAANQEYTYHYNVSSNPANWYVGEEIGIAYQPDHPTEPRLLTYWGSFAWTVVLMAVSMPLIVIGGGYYVAQHFLK